MAPDNALGNEERKVVLATVNSERFCNDSPRVIVARLADEDQNYLCSASTIYRILQAEDLVQERRAQRKHPHYVKPMFIAEKVNQIWSWDISKLAGPQKHGFYNAYVALDVYSRYIPGWMIADVESGDLARQFVAQTCAAWKIMPNALTLHADKSGRSRGHGAPMKSKSLYHLLTDLGVAASHSRPHTSNDNPFSESLFKTTKYHATYPGHFASIEQARAWMQAFVAWYNNEHHHSALAMKVALPGAMTPADVFFGRAKLRQSARQEVMVGAFSQHPERFTHGLSIVAAPPARVWLNPPPSEVAVLANHIP